MEETDFLLMHMRMRIYSHIGVSVFLKFSRPSPEGARRGGGGG